ncbi:MAG: hypothetical protein ACKVQA_06385 [Burkholderiales bacterium]
MRPSLFVLAIVLLGACATTEKYEAKLNKWRGGSATELLSAWGDPSGP